MTRDEYLEWVRSVTYQLAHNKYPDNKNLQLVHQLGMLQRALADLCYIDSDNGNRVNKMFKRNINGPSRPFKSSINNPKK